MSSQMYENTGIEFTKLSLTIYTGIRPKALDTCVLRMGGCTYTLYCTSIKERRDFEPIVEDVVFGGEEDPDPLKNFKGPGLTLIKEAIVAYVAELVKSGVNMFAADNIWFHVGRKLLEDTHAGVTLTNMQQFWGLSEQKAALARVACLFPSSYGYVCIEEHPVQQPSGGDTYCLQYLEPPHVVTAVSDAEIASLIGDAPLSLYRKMVYDLTHKLRVLDRRVYNGQLTQDNAGTDLMPVELRLEYLWLLLEHLIACHGVLKDKDSVNFAVWRNLVPLGRTPHFWGELGTDIYGSTGYFGMIEAILGQYLLDPTSTITQITEHPEYYHHLCDYDEASDSDESSDLE